MLSPVARLLRLLHVPDLGRQIAAAQSNRDPPSAWKRTPLDRRERIIPGVQGDRRVATRPPRSRLERSDFVLWRNLSDPALRPADTGLGSALFTSISFLEHSGRCPLRICVPQVNIENCILQFLQCLGPEGCGAEELQGNAILPVRFRRASRGSRHRVCIVNV
jgi:hypothetical protein